MEVLIILLVAGAILYLVMGRKPKDRPANPPAVNPRSPSGPTDGTEVQ